MAENEDWLLDRVVDYSIKSGFAEYTSTLREAWRASVCGLSKPILAAIEASKNLPEISPQTRYAAAEITAFGVEQAQIHRSRGIDLAWFLGLLKYYRRSYLDLIDTSDSSPSDKQHYRQFIQRFFDFTEMGLCSEWSRASDSEKLLDLQKENRRITNEKNKYLTIFESINEPVVLLDDKNTPIHLNYSAHRQFGGSFDPGASYYGAFESPLLNKQIPEIIRKISVDPSFEMKIETTDGIHDFNVSVQTMLDISKKFLGRVLIFNDVTAYKHAVKRAEVADRAKSVFLATISHEIRTPITGVLGLAKLLDYSSLSDQQRKYVEGILSSGQVLKTIVDDILNFSKAEAEALEVEEIVFDTARLVQEAVQIVENEVRQKKLDLVVDIAADVPPHLRGDSNKIRQILINILGNAVKFTSKGTITIRLSTLCDETIKGVPNKQKFLFEIIDTGVGIPDGGADWLFKPFAQQDMSTSRLYGGTGLGLAICENLTKLLGGTISYAPNPAGGSIFSIALPLGISDRAPEETNIEQLTSDQKQVLKILVVDDNEVNQMVAQGVLEKFGHRVWVTPNAEDALKMLEQHPFDLIMTDNRMSGMSGTELARRVRGHAKNEIRNIPIMMVTASIVGDDAEIINSRSIDFILEKPYLPSDLEQAIAGCLYASNRRKPLIIESAKGHTVPDFDESSIRGFLRDLGEERAMRIINAYLQTTPTSLKILDEACISADFQKISDVAHSLVSASKLVGLHKASGLAKKLEQAAGQRDESQTTALVADLHSTYAVGAVELKKFTQ